MQAPVPPLTITCEFSSDTRTTGDMSAANVQRMMEKLRKQGSEILHIRDATGAEFEIAGGELVFKPGFTGGMDTLLQEMRPRG